jgi:hypothetical protein
VRAATDLAAVAADEPGANGADDGQFRQIAALLTLGRMVAFK